MISILATLRIREDRAAEFERAFETLAQRVRDREPGNLLYQLYRDTASPCVYKVLELYRGYDDLEAHRVAPYVSEMRPAFAAMVAEPPRVEQLENLI